MEDYVIEVDHTCNLRSVLKTKFRGHVEPSKEWHDFVANGNFTLDAFFIENDGVKLEANLLTPLGGNITKPAVIFAGGSGDGLFQHYTARFIEQIVVNFFHSHDFAVLLMNKRGMGNSTGNWMHNDFEGRASDMYAGVQYLKTLDSIDSDRIGVMGHSQGGWIAPLVASQYDDVAFFISFAGPTTSVEDQFYDNYVSHYECQGNSPEKAAKKAERKVKIAKFAANTFGVLGIGSLGFDHNILDYDPTEVLKQITVPGLYLFGEFDNLVDTETNINRLNEIFDNNVPSHLSAMTISSANHSFKIVDDMCTSYEDSLLQPISDQLFVEMDLWLSGMGY